MPEVERLALPAQPEAPVDNIVLITVDTLRADALGFAGNAGVSTPTLDRLAASGWVFDNAHAQNVVTLPSHANILTGLYPYQHGVRDNIGFFLPESIPTAATLLGEVGFTTGAFVGAYPLDARYGLGRGFDRYDDEYRKGSHPTEFVVPERPGNEVVARALDWWRGQEGRRRFLWVHLYEPHAPYLPPEPFASRHREDLYLGEVEAVDDYLAPLLEPFLDRRETSSLILFTADHGEALGDHGEVTHGLFAYEATLKVPLVLWSDGLGPARTRFPAQHVDLLPTLLVAAGIKVPAELQGRPLFASTAGDGDPTLYFEALSSVFNQGFAPLRGVARDGYKFISLPLPELYFLENDPEESHNLIDAEPDRVRALARLLPSESAWPPDRHEVSSEAESALRSLGYLAGAYRRKSSYGPDDDPKKLVHLDRKVHGVVHLYQRNQLREAETLAREVIAERRDMSVAWTYLAQVLLQKGDTVEAISLMREAERLGLARDSLIRQLALSLAKVGRYEEALSVLEPFGRSDDPDLLKALGLVLSEAGRQGEAREILSRILESDPSSPVTHQNLALVALRRRAWEEARDHARRALEGNDGLGLAWNYLGTALYNLGRPREALDAWEKAIGAEPETFEALYNLALVASQIGDTSRSRWALEQFIASAPPERYGPDLRRARALLRLLGS